MTSNTEIVDTGGRLVLVGLMKKRFCRSLSWLVVVAIFALPLMSLPGAVDMFLDIEGADGESQDSVHKGEIDVLAWSWGMSNSGTTHIGGGGGAGVASFQDISVTKWIDKASPILMLYCAKGDYFPSAKLTVRKAGKIPIDYLIIEMKQVLVTSISTGGSGGEDRLTENVTLNFAQMAVKYTEQRADGTPGAEPEFRWDIQANKTN